MWNGVPKTVFTNSGLITPHQREYKRKSSAGLDAANLWLMMTSTNWNIFCVTGTLCGEFTGHPWIPLTKASDAKLWCFFYLRLNKRLSKQSRRWWFETPSRSLWCHFLHSGDWLRCIGNYQRKYSVYILQFLLYLFNQNRTVANTELVDGLAYFFQANTQNTFY